MAWKISNLVVFCCCSVCTWWWRILHEMMEFLLRNVWLSWTWNQSTAPYKFFESHRQASYWVHLAYGFKTFEHLFRMHTPKWSNQTLYELDAVVWLVWVRSWDLDTGLSQTYKTLVVIGLGLLVCITTFISFF